jgi:hypothetical protein
MWDVDVELSAGFATGEMEIDYMLPTASAYARSSTTYPRQACF